MAELNRLITTSPATSAKQPNSIRSRHSRKSGSHRSGTTSSRHTESSDVSSHSLRLRAKAEAAKARIPFVRKEAEIRMKKAELEADLNILDAEKEVAVAEAEADALDQSPRQSVLHDLPEEPAEARAHNYVLDLPSIHNVHDTLDPQAASFIPTLRKPDNIIASELTRLLLKKDLLLTSLVNFNDQPEAFNTWKVSFQSKMKDLEVSPLEEIDLLLKWTGPESQKHVLSLKAANVHNPIKGLERIWERLEERYGRPEMIEASLKRKLENFPTLTNKDHKKLYELSDIVSEIEAIKEDQTYSHLLGYFDSSSGVSPIVRKLPHNLQERWTTSANRYMTIHHISYPPFSYFSEFLREQSRVRNNPSFAFGTTSTSEAKPRPTRITNKKTSVTPDKTVDDTTMSSMSSSNKLASHVQHPLKEEEYCPLHHAKHALVNCKKFRAMPIGERRNFLRENSRCFRCCSLSHMRHTCKATIHCDECNSDKHVTALHYDYNQQNSKQTPTSNQSGEPHVVNSACGQICGENFSGKSCAKIVLVKVYHKNNPAKFEKMYALIDDQSNRSLVKTEFFEKFEGCYEDVPYSLSSCAGTVNTSGRRATGFVVEGVDGSTLDLPSLIECNEIPDIRHEIPTPSAASHHAHLQDIAPMIPKLDTQSSILLLIGRDLVEAHHVQDQRTGSRGSPYAQKLTLGWVIVGNVCLGSTHPPAPVTVLKTRLLEDGRPTIFLPCDNKFLVKDVQEETEIGANVFQQTHDDNKAGYSVEDKKFIKLMDKEFTKDQQGKWVAPLPFKSNRPRLANNRSQALKRARLLDVSLQRNPTKREHLQTFMAGIFDKGHAEVAPPLEPNEECWYLPLFGVYHPKKPGKIRGVFDSSAKYEGLSLNDVLMKGPDLTNSLIGVLLRFRTEEVAVIADIEQMFYCFSVKEEHRNFLRFVWYEDNDPSKRLVEYRMCKHVFGNSPSPAVATYGLRRTAQESETEFGFDVTEFVEKNFYVDDGLVSLPTVHEAVDLLHRTQQALLTCGIRLHKISSNSEMILDAFPSDDLTNELKQLELGTDTLPTQRSLGLCWDLQADTFMFDSTLLPKPYTRRGVLSTINSLFDPLGFLSPVTIQGRILQRDMVAGTLDWDEPLSEEFRHAWECWESSLPDLDSFRIPRRSPNLRTDTRSELHVYCDASEKAISAVAYLKTVDKDRNVSVDFVFGKSKVAPKHGHTIPRLELCASVLAVEVAEIICEELSFAPEETRFYSDSKVVLGYLTNETRRFYVYVANRVSRILQFSKPCQWSYVNTDQNPADHGTRYIPPALLGSSTWILGPIQLKSYEPIPSLSEGLINPDDDDEIRPEVTVLKCDTNTSKRLTLGSEHFNHFSQWSALIRGISFLHQFASRFKADIPKDCQGRYPRVAHKTVESMKRTETFIIKEVQHIYGKEIGCLEARKPLPKNSSVLKLDPVLDQDGVLRVGGRLGSAPGISISEKHPILIPGGHHVATLLIRHFHVLVKHQGRHFTEGAVRSAGYWITGGKRLISFILHKCVTCRKLRGRFGEQKMADLPSDRITPSPPFTSVGVDVFGHWNVITRRTRGGAASAKRWAVLFTCLTTRAIHIELVEEMSSSSFINALRRLYAIRGKIMEFRSDRGSNFVGATSDLNLPAINVEDEPIKNFLIKAEAVWKFNPPHASHFGGAWERLIGVARRILDTLLLEDKTNKLTHEVLVTFMAEVCAIVNARPIVPVSSDVENPSILSPSTLLTQKTGTLPDQFQHLDTKDMYRAQWKHVQVLAERFWKRWRSEYLPTIQTRQKWNKETPNIKEGDIVLIKDVQAPRNDWPVGIVNRAFPSDDTLVRKVELRVIREGKPCLYIRPISQIVVLVSENL